MSGWDRDERGDHAPPSAPPLIWLVLAAIIPGGLAAFILPAMPDP